MKAENIIQRYNSLKADRSDVEGVWRLLERFVRPLSGNFFETKEHDGSTDWRRRDIYDSTAIDAATSLAASLQGNLVSPSVKWFDLRYSNTGLNDSDAAKEWLEKAGETIFYELQQSNFNEQIGECFDDLVTFGTSVVVEELDEETGDLEFTAVPVREVYFEPGYRGQIKTFYRKLELTAVQIVDRFAPDGVITGLPQVVQDRYENNDVSDNNRFEVVYCVYERPKNEVPKDLDPTQPADPKALPFGYKYILHDGAEEIDEGGYYEMPAFIIRWKTTAGSRWGHSPGIYCLSNIMTLNQAIEDTLESVEKMIEPPIMTTQRGLLTDLDMRRGGITVVADMDDMAPFPVGGDVNASIIVVDDLRGQIRRAFYEDQLELKESPAMTATEVQVRYELMQRLLGPTLGRLQTDLLDPLIQRTFNICLREGKISAPTDDMGLSGTIEIEYVGPLPRAQKSDKAAAMIGLYGQLASLAEVNPALLDIVDADKLFTEVAQLTGVPASVIRSDAEIAQLRRERQAEMEKQAKRQDQIAQGEAMKSMGEGAGTIASLPPEGIRALQSAIPPQERAANG